MGVKARVIVLSGAVQGGGAGSVESSVVVIGASDVLRSLLMAIGAGLRSAEGGPFVLVGCIDVSATLGGSACRGRRAALSSRRRAG